MAIVVVPAQNGSINSLLPDHALSGSFDTQPTMNPIHVTAYSQDVRLNIGDLYSDDVCLPPSTRGTAPIYGLVSTTSPTGSDGCLNWHVHFRTILPLPRRRQSTLIVTDATDRIVDNQEFPEGEISDTGGFFRRQPTLNPIHFSINVNSASIADLYRDDPCLPPRHLLSTLKNPSVNVGCIGDRPSRLDQGMEASVIPDLPNALRDKPGLTKDGSKVIGWIQSGDKATVLDGPTCRQWLYVWWLVNYHGNFGWTPEGEGSTYWLQSTP